MEPADDDRILHSSHVSPEGLAVKSLEDLHDVSVVDPRIGLSSRPDAGDLDLSLGHQISNLVHHQQHQRHGDADSEKQSSPKVEEPFYVRDPAAA